MAYVKLIVVGLLASLLWAGLSLYGGLSGWWLEPVASRDDTRQFMDAATTMIDQASPGSVALVLIEDGAVFDEYYKSATDDVGAGSVGGVTIWPSWMSTPAGSSLPRFSPRRAPKRQRGLSWRAG